MLFEMPKKEGNIIKVIGVGGGGSNAVEYMYKEGILGVDFAICNTDKQAMEGSQIPNKIQLGPSLTDGKGAGNKPETGKEACLESVDDIRSFLYNDTRMLFVTAGMGGGTGTGAAPVVAKIAQEMDILTVGIVTYPFSFEGRKRLEQAMAGINELKKNVDTLIVISNDRIKSFYGNTGLSAAFSNADDILRMAAKGIAEIITRKGYVNVDFEDVNTVMRGSGVAIMGTATAKGENRAIEAIKKAIECPLIQDSDIFGAKNILLNISYGAEEVTMEELGSITEFIEELAGEGTDMIWGYGYSDALEDNELSVTLIATGFETGETKAERPKDAAEIKRVLLDETFQKPVSKPEIIEIPEKKEETFLISNDENEQPRTFEFEPKKKILANPNAGGFAKPSYPSNDSRNTVGGNEHYDKKDFFDQSAEKERSNDFTPAFLNKTHSLNEMEDIPAYKRRNIQLERRSNQQTYQERKLSSWSVNGDEKPFFSQDNSFFYDNVD